MNDKGQELTTNESAKECSEAEYKEEYKELTEGTAQIEDTVPELGKEIEQLKSALDEKTREAEENYKRFLLSAADLNNYKKRTEKEKDELASFANEQLIKEMLVVVDNLERAMEHINIDTDLNALRDGIKLTLEQFLGILKKFGLEQISSIGERFNPLRHEAITEEESENHEPGTVIKEFQKGYFLKDRLIRPAMVAVSKKTNENKI